MREASATAADEAVERPSVGQAFYLALERGPVFAVAHMPDAPVTPRTGVVLCPAFGWDELCSHRSLCRWADALAGDGYAALRFDLPGTGDSAGTPRDGGLFEAWVESVAAAARWLRSSAGCERVVGLGVGLGGLLAMRATASGAPIDDVVLWSVPARGTMLLRELRAFAGLAAGESTVSTDAPPPPPDDGSLEVAGFIITAETLAALESLDLAAITLPHAHERRALLLGRDAIGPDRRLREHLAGQGVEVTTVDGAGYGRMMTHPQFAETPFEVFSQVAAWLAEPPAGRPPDPDPTAPATPTGEEATIAVGDATIRETPFELVYEGQRLTGVLALPRSAPALPLCAVLLNAGAVRRIGPNRMWVESARRWAARGVASLRLDGVGLGDSDGDERRYARAAQFYRHGMAEQAFAAMNELEARGQPGRFLIGGLCSGAYWAFHAALEDERVGGVILVNLWPFFWSEEVAAAHDVRRARNMLKAGAWRDVARIATTDGRIGRLARMKLRNVVRTRRRDPVLAELDHTVDDALDGLRERAVQMLLLLSDGEPLIDDLISEGRMERLAEWPNLCLKRIPIEDHIFRPVWAQQFVHASFDDCLARTLAAKTPASR